MTGLLSGDVVVVEFGDSISAWVCGYFLRCLGARVVRVEPPSGSPLSSTPPTVDAGGRTVSALAEYLNRDKLTVTGDLDRAGPGSEIADLLQESDVLLLSGTWANCLSQVRGSVGALPGVTPNLIVGSVSMFGDVEPYCDLVGGELQVLALGGLLHMIGDIHREPVRLGGYQAQYAGGLSLLAGVLLALFRRDQTSLGADVVTSCFEAVAYIEWKSAVQYQQDGSTLTRGSLKGPLVLPCADGFSAFYYRPHDWANVKKLFTGADLDVPEFATQALRDENRTTLFDALAEVTRCRSKLDIYRDAQALGIPVGYMATVADLLESPQYRSRGFLERIDVGDAEGRVPREPWRLRWGEPTGDGKGER